MWILCYARRGGGCVLGFFIWGGLGGSTAMMGVWLCMCGYAMVHCLWMRLHLGVGAWPVVGVRTLCVSGTCGEVQLIFCE